MVATDRLVLTPVRAQDAGMLEALHRDPGIAPVVLASRAVMEKLGMAYVRELRRPGLVAGSDVVQDDAPFALYTTGILRSCA